MGIAIKVENLSKAYQLGEIGTGTLSRDLERYWAKLRGKEDPFLKIGETNDRTQKGESDVVWSLKDLNFEIEKGDAVGIIGRNGAGKSTLLKILSRVTSPTTGSVKVKGRVASLLEVGTGFHPELSGRDNIFLNGAILGMRKAEIKKHFDAIVDFAGVERYIDTPVKRYSSGMYVRLAFAVAAHLESEILVVDEVLAVGDAEFQKKCLGKMNEVNQGEGRTVLFVSHNMGSIQNLCKSGILLKNGLIEHKGDIPSTIEHYQSSNFTDIDLSIFKDRKGTGEIRVNKIEIINKNGLLIKEVSSGQDFAINFYFEKLKNFEISPKLIPSFQVKDRYGNSLILHHSRLNNHLYDLNNGITKGVFSIKIKDFPLIPSLYYLSFTLQNYDKMIDVLPDFDTLNVTNSNYYLSGEMPPPTHASCILNAVWN